MTPAQWHKLEQIFDEASALEPSRRSAFIDQACGSDDELKKEVASLLASAETDDSFLAEPARNLTFALLKGADDLRLGTTVGPYRILSVLGSGGMGDVFLAHDTRLNRKVALKFLPPAVSHDRERARRFKQEAHAASTISHPNVAPIYEVRDDSDLQFISMEYVEGETLRQRLKAGPLDPDRAVDIAIQVALALEAAHSAGVIHRDIKPENLMLRPDGYVKVLDFSLAKLIQHDDEFDSTAASTIQTKSTEIGRVIGTALYMSPEQARGTGIDARTDIWSLGVVLFEMLSCATPFKGATTVDVIAAVLTAEPEPLPHSVPSTLAAIIDKALKKDRHSRFATATEMRLALESFRSDQHIAGLYLSLTGSSRLGRPMSVIWQESQKGSTESPGRLLRALLLGSKTFLTEALRLSINYRAASLAMVCAILFLISAWIFYGGPQKPVIRADSEAFQFFTQAEACLERREYGRARGLLVKGIKLEPQFVPAHVGLAEAIYEMGSSREAEEELTKARELLRNNRPNASLLKFFYSNSPDTYDEKLLAGSEKAIRGQFNEAATIYREMISDWPENEGLYFRLGSSYEKDGKLEAALDTYNKFSAKTPQNPAALLRIALVNGRIGNVDKAEEVFSKFFIAASKSDQSFLFAQGLFERARFLAEIGRTEESRQLLEVARTTAIDSIEPVVEVKSLLYQIDFKQQQVSQMQRKKAEKDTVALLEKEITAMQLEMDRKVQTTQTQNTLIRTLMELGEGYFRKRDYATATGYFREVADSAERSELDRLEKGAILFLTEAALFQEDRNGAITALSIATRTPKGGIPNLVNRDPSMSTIIQALELRISKSDYQGAIAYIDHQISLSS
jgi:serine/threonine protein kinase/thioredoxin-like negative regulator of GroEL